MAEAAILPRRPEHLRALEIEARAIVERQAGRTLYYPDDVEAVQGVYLSLREQAYQRDLEPFVRIAARSIGLCLPEWCIVNGALVRTEAPLQAEVRRHLDRAAAALRRHYELEPTNG